MQILRMILLGPPTQPAIDTTCEGTNSDFTSSIGLCKQEKNGPLAPSSDGTVAMKKCGHPMCYFSVTGRKCLLAEEQREEDKKLELLSAVRFLRKAQLLVSLGCGGGKALNQLHSMGMV
ncbi:unnamed protein product [Prunus brigantina]